MISFLAGKRNAGILVPGIAALVALVGLLARLPRSPIRVLSTQRNPAMALDSAIAFLLCAVIAFCYAIRRARPLRITFAAVLLIGGAIYPIASLSDLPSILEHATLRIFGLFDGKSAPPMPIDTALAFGLYGLIVLLLERSRAEKDHPPWALFLIASGGTLLVTFGSLSLLHTLVQLPFSTAWAWTRSLSHMAPETAVLFILFGFQAATQAVGHLPATNAQRSFLAGIFAAVSMLLLFVSINITLKTALAQNLAARANIRDAHQSRTAVEQLAAFVREAESEQRGYLLTSDEQYLAAYQNSERQAQLLAAKPLQVGNDWPDVQAFRQTVGRKLDELRETVLLRQAGKYQQAQETVKSGVGRTLMERILALRDAIDRSMDAQIEARNAEYWRSAEVVSRTVYASYGLAAALLICAIASFRGEIKRRAAVESRLRANESDLEERILQRTGELQASENRYRALLEQSPIAAHIYAADGTTIAINPAFERLFGVEAHQLEGYNVLRDPRPLAPGARELIERTFAGEVTSTPPIRHERTQSGQENTPWLEVTGYPVKNATGAVVEVVLLCHDVTDREAALHSLRESEAHFRKLADSLPQMIWTADAQLKPVYLNSRWYEITGWHPNDLNNDFFELVHAEDRDACREMWITAINTETPFQQDYRLFDATREEYRWYLARAIPLQDEKGKLTQWFGSCTEIHEQKEAEGILESRVAQRTDELQRSNQLLRASEEALREALRERETLFKEVHHRVKNNLQVISSLLRMKGQTLIDQPAAVMALEESRRRVQSMAFIHESLYAHGSLDQIDFAAYTGTLVQELIFSYATPSRPIDFRVDADRIDLNVEQAIPCGLILNELVTNALKYAFKNRNDGLLIVTLRHVAADQVLLQVQDDGVGLPEGLELAKLESLGLPIVEILTRQIGGSLEVKSNKTSPGACFAIHFPRQASANRAA